MSDEIENSDRKFRYHNKPMSAVSNNRVRKAIVKESIDTHFEALNIEMDIANRQWMRRLLHEILEQLPERQRQALTLCEGNGLKIREAATKIGCSKSTVQRSLKAALKFAEEYIKNN